MGSGNKSIKKGKLAIAQKPAKKEALKPKAKVAVKKATANKKPSKKSATKNPKVKDLPVSPKKKPAKKEAVKKGGKKRGISGSRREESTKACQDKFLEALANNRFCIYKACKEAGISRRIFYHWRDADSEFMGKYDDLNEAKIDAWEEALHRNIQAGDSVSIIFGLKMKGRKRGYGDKPMPSKEAVSIINDLLAEKITVKEAAYKLYLLGEQIPDVMKIELEKTPVETPPPELPPAMSDEELEEAYQKGLAKQREEKEKFLPQRQEDVRQIKEELKNIDSFIPDVGIKKDSDGGAQL